MKIATFNINGIKARLPALTDWLVEALTQIMIKCREQSYVTRDVEEITGRPATTVAAWFEKNQAAFLET